MFKKLKKQSQNKISIFYIAIFIILAGFVFFGNIQSASADVCTATDASGKRFMWDNISNETSCKEAAATNNLTFVSFVTSDELEAGANTAQQQGFAGETLSTAQVQADAKFDEDGDICPGIIGDVLSGSALKVLIGCPLRIVLKFNAMLLGASAYIFAGAVDADKLQAVINNPALYVAWGQVRDVLNITFILFLLYSAFSIIFQVGGKYGEKKIILTIVLMALLVNFSFPITRFIIDASNSLMYTLMAQLMPTDVNHPESIFTNITRGSALKTILAPKSDAPLTVLLAAVIFSFMLALTFLALAVMFLIRMVALAALIIFSPIAFVGNIAGKDFGWWKYLFNYAFFGPVMILALAISINIMEAIGSTLRLSGNDSVVSAMANMSIPIIILWMSMGIAKQMGIAGADKVVKNFGGAKPLAQWISKKSGLTGGVKKGWENMRKDGKFLGKKIPLLKDGQEGRETLIGGALSGGGDGIDKARKGLAKKNFDEDSKKASEGLETETTDAITGHLTNPANHTNALRDRAEATKFAGHAKQLFSDPARMDEWKNTLRNDTRRISNANSSVNTEMSDPAMQTALHTLAENAARSAGLTPASPEWSTAVSNAHSQAETAKRTEIYQRTMENMITQEIKHVRDKVKEVRNQHTDI